MVTKNDIDKFEMFFPMLISIFNEVKEFSKKKPDECLNELKVKKINKILEQIKGILKDEPTNEFLDLLDNETLPTNSDAVLILTQYIESMKQFKEKNTSDSSRISLTKWNI